MKGFIARLSNVGAMSKFLIAIISDVQVNMHTGWTSTTGIITDVLALAVYLVPNATSSKSPVS